MGNRLSYGLLLILFVVVGGCVEGTTNQSVEIMTPPELGKERHQVPDYFDSEFSDGMVGAAFEYYLYLSTALVLEDTNGANTAASNLAASFSVDRETLKSLAEKIEDSANLNEQRKYFAQFSEQFEPLLSMSVKSGTIYKQSCSAALDQAGAVWFSDAKIIQNPYTADVHCGSVDKMITGN